MTYDTYGRMTTLDDTTITNDSFIVQQRYDYDADGSLWLEHSRELDSFQEPSINIYDQTRSYHSVDGKLSVVNRHIGISGVSDETHSGRHQVYQENWYDALGRRVLVRARKSSNCSNATHGDLRWRRPSDKRDHPPRPGRCTSSERSRRSPWPLR